MSKESRPSRMNQLKRSGHLDKERSLWVGSVAFLASVAKRRNLLGLVGTRAEELSEAKELVRTFRARRNVPPRRSKRRDKVWVGEALKQTDQVHGHVRLRARQADSSRQCEQQPLVPGRGPRAGAATVVLRLHGPARAAVPGRPPALPIEWGHEA